MKRVNLQNKNRRVRQEKKIVIQKKSKTEDEKSIAKTKRKE